MPPVDLETKYRVTAHGSNTFGSDLPAREPDRWEAVFETNFRTITRAKKKIIRDRDDLFFVKMITDRVAEVAQRL